MEHLRKHQEKQAKAKQQQTVLGIQNARLVQSKINSTRQIGKIIRNMNQTMKNVNTQTKGMNKATKNALAYTRVTNAAQKVKNESIQTLQKLQREYNQKLTKFKQENQTNFTRRKIQVFSNIKNAIDKELHNATKEKAVMLLHSNELEELNNTNASGATQGGRRKTLRRRR